MDANRSGSYHCPVRDLREMSPIEEFYCKLLFGSDDPKDAPGEMGPGIAFSLAWVGALLIKNLIL